MATYNQMVRKVMAKAQGGILYSKLSVTEQKIVDNLAKLNQVRITKCKSDWLVEVKRGNHAET